MKHRLEKAKTYLHRKQAEQSLLKKQSEEIEQTLLAIKEHYEDALQARSIIQKVAKELQQTLQFHISNLVTHAISSVFDEDIEFVVEFVEKRGQTECDFYYLKNGEKYKPITSSGGGLLDITSFALRLSFWQLNKTREVFLFDESFKFVSKDKMDRAVSMVKELSQQLGVQFLIVSHIPDFIEGCDKEFRIEGGEIV